MKLFDTNIFIEIYRDNTVVCAVAELVGHNSIAISDVVRAELFYGAKNKRELGYICKDLAEFVVLPIVPEISSMAAELVKCYCLSHKLHITDALIAATAIYYNVELYTLNIKDFAFIPKMQLFYPS
jgi:predicted nucleic acid-binding protein